MNNLFEFIRLHIILPIAELFIGTMATYWFKQICKMEKWSKNDIINWQEKQLQEFIKHAYENTTYYHQLFDSLGLKPNDIKHIEDLKKIPILTKEIINSRYEEFIPTNINKYKFRKGKTGGTTGQPMLYLCDENTWGYITAAKIYYWKKAGWRYGEKFAAFGSASLFGKSPSMIRKIYDKIRNEIPMNSVNLDNQLCEKYYQQIVNKNISCIYGYAASIYIFAQYIAKQKYQISQIKIVFTTSENLLDQYRQFIQNVFHCQVVDCYGARDAGITAYETSYHHYNVGYNVILELENKINNNSGTAISTNILNKTFPLIRYQYGDELVINTTNDDSYNGQVLSQILGRTSDVMRLANGRNLTATGFSMIMKEFDILAFDINMIDSLTVQMRILPNKELYTAAQESKIRQTICKYIGEDCNFIIKYVDCFTELPNGKRRYFMNDIFHKIDSCKS